MHTDGGDLVVLCHVDPFSSLCVGVCVCIFGFVRSHPPHISCIWSWVVLFSPLPFWFSHIGFYRSRFIHTIRFFYSSLSVLPFHSIFRSFLHHFSWLRLFSSALFLRPRVNLCAENSWFLPLDKFLMICGHTIYTLTHWRRYIKWNKLAKALFIIAFFPFAFKNSCSILPLLHRTWSVSFGSRIP